MAVSYCSVLTTSTVAHGHVERGGSYFGDVGAMLMNRHLVCYRAAKTCQLYSLAISALSSVKETPSHCAPPSWRHKPMGRTVQPGSR